MKLGIIGIGHIAQYHFEAIGLIDGLELTSVCDHDYSKLENVKLDVDKYNNSNDLISSSQVDVVMIATPTESHAKMAEHVIKAGKPVILEKPAALTFREFNLLKSLSLSKKVPVFTLFHASYGYELTPTFEILNNLENKDGLVWKSFFSDPYEKDAKAKSSLVNSWVDSGINFLSILQRVLSPDSIDLIFSSHTPATGEEKSKICSNLVFEFSGNISGTAIIECNWSKGINRKVSKVRIQNKHWLILEHSDQSLVELGRRMTIDNELPRLTNHYIAAFEEAKNFLSQGKSNWAFSEACHHPYWQGFKEVL